MYIGTRCGSQPFRERTIYYSTNRHMSMPYEYFGTSFLLIFNFFLKSSFHRNTHINMDHDSRIYFYYCATFYKYIRSDRQQILTSLPKNSSVEIYDHCSRLFSSVCAMIGDIEVSTKEARRRARFYY